MIPFDLLEYEEPEPLDRAIGVQPKWNAWVEIHNLIAAAASIRDYGPADALRICREYGLDFVTSFGAERVGLYRTFLDYCLDRGDLAERDRRVLAHLADTLRLTNADLQPVHERAFGRTVSNVLSDDCVSLEERLLLYKLQHTLGLDPRMADGTYEAVARERLLTTVAHAVCDGMLSPEERKEIEALRAEVGIEIPPTVEKLLAEAARNWAIQHGPLPTVSVGILLLPAEYGHFQTAGQWQRLNYARLRVALSAQRISLTKGDTDRLVVPRQAVSGKLYNGLIIVSNKRLIMKPERLEPVAYYVQSLGEIERYRNGLRVGLPEDRSLFLDAGRASRALHSVLFRLLNP